MNNEYWKPDLSKEKIESIKDTLSDKEFAEEINRDQPKTAGRILYENKPNIKTNKGLEKLLRLASQQEMLKKYLDRVIKESQKEKSPYFMSKVKEVDSRIKEIENLMTENSIDGLKNAFSLLHLRDPIKNDQVDGFTDFVDKSEKELSNELDIYLKKSNELLKEYRGENKIKELLLRQSN